MGSIVYPVHRSIACHNLHKRNNLRGNLYPWKRLLQSPLCPEKQDLPLFKITSVYIEEIASRKNEITYFDWSDSFTTGGTFRRKHSVVIVYTINFIVHIHGEGNTVKTFVANATSKASWMIRLPHCLQYLWTREYYG